jgi:hypothetical protein
MISILPKQHGIARPSSSSVMLGNNPSKLNYIKLRNPSLTRLVLKSEEGNPSRIRKQLKVFSSFRHSHKRIQGLAIDFMQCSNFTDKELSKLSNQVSTTMPKLRQITLIESKLPCLTAEGYKLLGKTLRKLKTLEEVNLSLNPRYHPLQALAHIAHSIKSLAHLTKLHLSLASYYHSIGGQAFSQFALGLQHHTGLTELSFFVNGCKIDNPEYLNSFAKSLQRLVNLKKLNLELYNTKLTGESLSEMAVALKPLQSLTSLSLNFPECNRPADLIGHEILKSIAGLTKLTTLNLDLGRNLPAPNFTQVAVTLRELTQLTSLRLQFGNNSYLDDNSGCQIAQGIASLTHLTKLDLDLSNCTALTDQTLMELATALSRDQLESLKLDISRNRNFSNISLKLLAPVLNNLRKLKINLRQCSKFNENGIAAFTSKLGNFDQLTSLILQFDDCAVTNKNLQQLDESLGNLTNLTTFGIRLSGCTQINDEGMAYLAHGLDNLPRLTKLMLGTPMGSGTSTKFIQQLYSTLKAKKYLRLEMF